MRKGPRGATVERQVEITETLTWTFTAAELRKRLSLPDGAALFTDGIPTDVLTATVIATRTRKPKEDAVGHDE